MESIFCIECGARNPLNAEGGSAAAPLCVACGAPLELELPAAEPAQTASLDMQTAAAAASDPVPTVVEAILLERAAAPETATAALPAPEAVESRREPEIEVGPGLSSEEAADPLIAAAVAAYSGAARAPFEAPKEPPRVPAPAPASVPTGARFTEREPERSTGTDAPVVSNAYSESEPFQRPRRPSPVLIGGAVLALVSAFFLGRSTGPGAGEAQTNCPPKLDASAGATVLGALGNPIPTPVASAATANPAPSADSAATPGRSSGSASIAGVQTKAGFDPKAASRALKLLAARAHSCKRPGDPHGSAVVTVTFANTGHAAAANVTGAPFSGTPTASCIAALLRSARVPAFAGEPITVKKTIAL